MSRNLILTDEPQYSLLEWARSRCGVVAPKWSPDAEALGVLDGDALRAVIVFNAFYGDACCAHIASDHTRRWATRNILGGIFGYAFHYRRMNRLTAMIPAQNRNAILMAVKLGFQFEGRMRDAAVNGDDAVMLSMLKDECIWTRTAAPTSTSKEGASDDGQ